MWKIAKLSEMDSTDFYKCLRLRVDTFVVEQTRIYHELDDNDPIALHVYHLNDDQQVDAYARVYPEGDHIAFGRVVTAKSARGKGLGRPLMEHILKACQQLSPHKDIIIAAQQQVTGYYAKFGFKSVGEPFMHEGTMHITMKHAALN